MKKSFTTFDNTIETMLKNVMKRLVFCNTCESVHAMRLLFTGANTYENIKDTKEFFCWETSDFLNTYKNRKSQDIEKFLQKTDNIEMIKIKMQIDLHHVEKYLRLLLEDPNKGINKLNKSAEMLLFFEKREQELKTDIKKKENRRRQTILCSEEIFNQQHSYPERVSLITNKIMVDIRIVLPIETRYLISNLKVNKDMARFRTASQENTLKRRIEFYKLQIIKNNDIHFQNQEFINEHTKTLRDQIEKWSYNYDMDFEVVETDLNKRKSKLANLKDLFRSKQLLLEEYRQGLIQYLEKEAEKERLRLEQEESKSIVSQLEKRQRKKGKVKKKKRGL